MRSVAEIETFVASKNSNTSSVQPHNAGNTKRIETPETIVLPVKCTFDITKNAIAAGIENIALITPIAKYSDSVVISKSDKQDEATTAKPESIASAPAAKFFFTG